MRILSTLGLLVVTAVVSAHHSRSHYSDDIQEIEGNLVEVHWVNPHVGFTVSVANDDGEQELWVNDLGASGKNHNRLPHMK